MPASATYQQKEPSSRDCQISCNLGIKPYSVPSPASTLRRPTRQRHANEVPRPTISKYYLRQSVRNYLRNSPSCDNLVSVSPSLSTMPPADTRSGKETAPSMGDVISRLDRLEEIMCTLTAKVGDVDQQQQAFTIAPIRLEQGRSADAPLPPADPAHSADCQQPWTSSSPSTTPWP
jgi:hypothetical protein